MSVANGSSKSSDVSGLKLQNSERFINKLPSELLLRIFGVGDEEQRAKRDAREAYDGFQDLVTWRNVAINAPALWTYIYVSRPPPHRTAALYLDRCGPTTLLDIDLDMMNNFFDKHPDFDNWPAKTSRTGKAIEFLMQHGAIPSRWKSLTIRSEVPQVLYKTLEYVHPQSAPALQYLSVEWSLRMNLITAIESETRSLSYLLIFNNIYPRTNETFLRLRHVEFITMPAGFLFGQSLPMLSGLTRLRLVPAFKLYSQAQLYELLSANSQLESLDIGGGIIDEDFEPTHRRVVLPSLRSLSVASGASCAWTLGILKMINGPAIEHLKLSYYGYQPDKMVQVIEQIVGHIASEDSTDASPVPTHNQALSRQSIYPALRRLDVSGMRLIDDRIKPFRDLFSLLPSITFLVARASLVSTLGDQPWLLPHLERIKLVGEPPEELCRILHRRAEGGYPIKTLETHEQFLSSIHDTFPESLTIAAVPGVYYDSDDEDEIDEDDFDEDFDEDYDDDEDYEDYEAFADLNDGWPQDDVPASFLRHFVGDDDEDYYEGGYDDDDLGYEADERDGYEFDVGEY
ncbi:hypothetical protein FRC09_003794 [Ceratobasidium sp. 395]|nr:hypothetical protein FRC09_003794 [Ceratobasidium sp. 395]